MVAEESQGGIDKVSTTGPGGEAACGLAAALWRVKTVSLYALALDIRTAAMAEDW
jgi:hypothetical protein